MMRGPVLGIICYLEQRQTIKNFGDWVGSDGMMDGVWLWQMVMFRSNDGDEDANLLTLRVL